MSDIVEKAGQVERWLDDEERVFIYPDGGWGRSRVDDKLHRFLPHISVSLTGAIVGDAGSCERRSGISPIASGWEFSGLWDAMKAVVYDVREKMREQNSPLKDEMTTYTYVRVVGPAAARKGIFRYVGGWLAMFAGGRSWEERTGEYIESFQKPENMRRIVDGRRVPFPPIFERKKAKESKKACPA